MRSKKVVVPIAAVTGLGLLTLSASEYFNNSQKKKVDISKIKLTPVIKGAVAGAPIEAGSLWSNQPVMIHVVRRPG